MYTLNITKAIKKEIREFIFEKYFKTLEKKDLLSLANKLIEKIPGTRNAQEHYQSFERKKKTKSVKQ